MMSGSFKRRDYLLGVESRIRSLWDRRNPYEVEHSEEYNTDDSFYVTFPFPYMNGRLHLGHAFSLTKSDFTARFQKLQGKHVLWPFAFHCTGMPIAACADKLKHEIEDVEQNKECREESVEKEMPLSTAPMYVSKKSKSMAKNEGHRTQREILLSIGVPESEIFKFADAHHWLTYFPPLGKKDLQTFGLAVDWRRTFITTDANPYFDKFVHWQFRLLLQRNRIKFGLRPTIFSRIDNQPCADHDRATGEAANPQSYTLIKLKVKCVPDAWTEKSVCLKGKDLYFVAATLRPETMYGQTNCFVLPDGEYGVYPAFKRQLSMDDLSHDQKGYVACKVMTAKECNDLSVFFIASERSAGNMVYQGIIPAVQDTSEHIFPKARPVMTLTGREMIGVPLEAPLSMHDTIFSLPLPSIKMDKGTGIVTSVPSDAPDDYAMLKELQTKVNLRNQYGVKLEWCDKDIIEVLEIPEYGRRSAVLLYEKNNVASWKDEVKLKEIKHDLYTKGFYEGVMVIGEYAGTPVKQAKELIRKKLIDAGQAIDYLEPERRVMSRSGDDCVVALCNQWYSDFSDIAWKEAVMHHVEKEDKFNAFGQRGAYLHTVNWLQGWACSRNYGLGSLLPWEAEQGNRVLIESLSDSTVYFAYYTIAHMLQGDMYGQTPGSLDIIPEQLTMEVFNYVFCQVEDLPSNSAIPENSLMQMRNAFTYWYPMNLRCSGKDLVPNHLTMSLFHHAAIWPHRPDLWPRGYFVNGHLLLDSEKMSKSTGNFLTLDEACQNYTADGTRIALADAGDSVDDANFERQTANIALMRLYVLNQFIDEVLIKKEQGKLRRGDESKTRLDLLIENEIIGVCDRTKEAYLQMNMRDALKFSFFEFLSLKDSYRNILEPNLEFHEDVILKWVETIAVIISPIACHMAEYIWSFKLNKPNLVVNEQWPSFDKPFAGGMHRQYNLLIEVAEGTRRQLEKHVGKKGKGATFRPNAAVLFVAQNYQPWQEEILKQLADIELDPISNTPLNEKYIQLIKDNIRLKEDLSTKQFQQALAFASHQMKEEVKLRGPSALELSMPFDELILLQEHSDYLKRSIGIAELTLRRKESSDNHSADPVGLKKDLALPGRPSVAFYVTECA